MNTKSGWSVLEILMVLGVASIVLLVWGHAQRSPLASRADELARTITSHRWRAVSEARPVRLGGALCESPNYLSSRVVDTTVHWPSRGLLFTPDGLPRTCDGGGVGNTTILLEHRGRQAAVIVSSLGRVRWELR